jgi:hypothetical protein
MMTNLDGCQIPCLPKIADGLAEVGPQPWRQRFKRSLAVPWNYYAKRWLKQLYRYTMNVNSKVFPQNPTSVEQKSKTRPASLQSGDWVRVRSLEEIQTTLNPWKELKGCAFLPYMVEYCGTTQRVLKPLQRFLDERDYKVKKARGVVLLEGVICQGTPVFGPCDRSCYLFWREEWLEKIDDPTT